MPLKSNCEHENQHLPTWLIVGIVIIGLSCIASINTGYVGIVTTFGKVEDYTFDSDKAFEVLTIDKKSSKNFINYIMISKIGDVVIKEISREDRFLVEE